MQYYLINLWYQRLRLSCAKIMILQKRKPYSDGDVAPDTIYCKSFAFCCRECCYDMKINFVNELIIQSGRMFNFVGAWHKKRHYYFKSIFFYTWAHILYRVSLWIYAWTNALIILKSTKAFRYQKTENHFLHVLKIWILGLPKFEHFFSYLC